MSPSLAQGKKTKKDSFTGFEVELSPGATISEPKANNKSLTNVNHSISDLYASVLFSKSRASDTVDAIDLSYDELARYPAYGYDEAQRYGQLAEPLYNGGNNKASAVGGRLVSRIRTLYKYGWIEPAPDDEGLLGRMGALFCSKLESLCGIGEFFNNSDLFIARVSAQMYETVGQWLEWFRDNVFGFDAFKVLSVMADTSQPASADGFGELSSANIVDSSSFSTKATDPSKKLNMLEGLVHGFLINHLGFTPRLFNMIRLLVVAYFVFVLLTIAIIAFALKNRRGVMSKAKRTALKLFVVLNVIPLVVLLSSTISAVERTMIGDDVEGTKLSTLVTDNFIINVLDWAVYTNLDMSVIGNSNDWSVRGEVVEEFKPTLENVQHINNNIRIAKHRLGGEDADATVSPVELIDIVTGNSDVVFTVSDYFSGLSAVNSCSQASPDTSGYSGGVCERNLKALDDFAKAPIQLGKADEARKDLYEIDKSTVAPYFININKSVAKATKGGGGGSSAGLLGSLLPPGGSTTTPPATGGSTTSTTPKISGDPTQERVFSIMGTDFTIKPNSEITIDPFNYYNASAYLYGAVRPGNATEVTKRYANYINKMDATNQQLINPNTGNFVGVEPEKSSDDDEAKALRANAYKIGLFNRYSGYQFNVNGVRNSFNDQSMAFFLQTKPIKNGVSYKGYNTIAGEAGESANTGVNGVKFIKYSMPAVDDDDFAFRIGLLATTFQIMGILTLFSILFVLKAPILLAGFRSAKALFRALFAGDLVSLLQYGLYYSAIRFSFAFAIAGINVAGGLASTMLVSAKPASGGVGGMLGVATKSGFERLTEIGLDNTFALKIVLLFVIGLAVFPVFNIRKPNGNGSRKISILEGIVTVPFLVAEALSDDLEEWRRRYFNNNKSIVGVLGNKVSGRGISRVSGQEYKDDVKNKVLGAGRLLMDGALVADAVNDGFIGKGSGKNKGSRTNNARMANVAGRIGTPNNKSNVSKNSLKAIGVGPVTTGAVKLAGTGVKEVGKFVGDQYTDGAVSAVSDTVEMTNELMDHKDKPKGRGVIGGISRVASDTVNAGKDILDAQTGGAVSSAGEEVTGEDVGGNVTRADNKDVGENRKPMVDENGKPVLADKTMVREMFVYDDEGNTIVDDKGKPVVIESKPVVNERGEVVVDEQNNPVMKNSIKSNSQAIDGGVSVSSLDEKDVVYDSDGKVIVIDNMNANQNMERDFSNEVRVDNATIDNATVSKIEDNNNRANNGEPNVIVTKQEDSASSADADLSQMYYTPNDNTVATLKNVSVDGDIITSGDVHLDGEVKNAVSDTNTVVSQDRRVVRDGNGNERAITASLSDSSLARIREVVPPKSAPKVDDFMGEVSKGNLAMQSLLSELQGIAKNNKLSKADKVKALDEFEKKFNAEYEEHVKRLSSSGKKVMDSLGSARSDKQLVRNVTSSINPARASRFVANKDDVLNGVRTVRSELSKGSRM